ncbi:MAG: hypothetical protein KAI66_16755 [Lentisphaeria bacterium]|nr:hypothetical protein [Lentisphaeria bacterium]
MSSTGNKPASAPLDFSAFSWTMRPGASATLQALAKPLHGVEAVPVKRNWRRTVYRVNIDGDSYFLKHTRGDRFTSWVRGMLHCNGRLEFESGRALENAGVPVVPHLAWARRGADSVVVTAAVEPSRDLDDCWETARRDPHLRPALLAAIATLLESMARAGVKHRDFHPGNVLVTELDGNAPKAMLVDVLGVHCGSDSKSAVLDRLRLTVVLRPKLRLDEARMLARASLVGVTQTEAEKTLHTAHLHGLDAFRHRWPGIRKRLSGASSICEERRTDEGRWLLHKPFPLEQAEEAVAQHLRNMENETDVVKRDVKRCLSRVRMDDETFLVKEFVCPGPWGSFRSDARSWFAAHRLHTRLVPAAASLAWLKHNDGRGFQILEDVGEKTLMDEMREGADWQRRRRMIEAAGQIIGLLHAARVDHGDLKPANFVSGGCPLTLRLVDFDGMRFPRSPLLRAQRARGFEQLFENLHRYMTPREACRFLLSYATYAGVPTRLAHDLLPDFPDWGTETP